MAITSAEIHNQSFSIDRKGYDVDEVDVFLEHVADEIDGLNQQIASLQSQIGEDSFAGFDRPATFDDEAFDEPEPEHAAEQDDQPADSIDPTILAEKDAAIAERDARIAELEKQLESKKADGNAIAQALIIAQRSADEILANAKADAAATIKDAEDEADRILDKAENDRQKVIDAIHKLEDDREEVREDYRDLLNDFITDATRKLAEIGEKAPKAAGALASGQHGRYATHVEPEPVVKEAAATAPQAPLTVDGSDAYDDAPAIPAAVPAAAVTAAAVTAASPAVTGSAAPVASSVEKDFSGFGDAADDFEIDDLD